MDNLPYNNELENDVSITVGGLNTFNSSYPIELSPNLTCANVIANTNLSSYNNEKFILLYISLNSSLNINNFLFYNSDFGIFYN